MRYRLAGIAMVAAISLSACQSGRSSRSNPTAFCSAVKKLAVQSAGIRDDPTPSLIKAEATSLQHLEGIAPPELESAVTTEADAWNQYVKTGNQSELVGQKYAAANDQIETWLGEYCTQ